ncbi:lysozyme inhibitor LprI family protein [Flavobacterium procerum]|uniref:Lysozyme inhibitor LprI family protein n=1 Tax=Flavobacterium procerum TaxID=1455569 RepID=A0ABV6C0H9_9FLAO
MIQKALLVLLVLISLKSNSQTLETVYKLKSNYQKCLDKGIDMRGCSLKYYNQSDSLLNVAYNNLKSKISSKEQSKLKKEQVEWLKKRDQFFEKIYSDTKKEGHFKEGTQDFEMIVLDEEAKFVFGRVKELIKRS